MINVCLMYGIAITAGALEKRPEEASDSRTRSNPTSLKSAWECLGSMGLCNYLYYLGGALL